MGNFRSQLQLLFLNLAKLIILKTLQLSLNPEKGSCFCVEFLLLINNCELQKSKRVCQNMCKTMTMYEVNQNAS